MASSNLLHNWQSIGAKEEAILEDVYKKTPDPPATVKLDLALELHVSPQNIGRWFSARKRRDAGERRANRKDPEQLEVLERYFSRNPFPTREEKAEICEQTGCSLRQINSWFQHSRKKHNMTDLNNLPGTCLRQWHKQAADHIRSAIIEQNEKIFGDALGPAEGDETAEPASAYDSNVTLNDQAPHKPQTRSRPSKRKRAKSPESGASEQEEEELSGRGVAEDFSIDEDRDDPTYSDHQKEDIGQRRSQRRQAQHRRIGGKPEATTRALSTNTSRSRTPTDFEPIHIQHAAAVSDSFSRPSDSGPLPMFSTNDIGPSRGHGSGSLGGPSAAGDSDGYTPNRMSVTFPARVPFVVQQDAPGRPAVLKLPSPNESEGSPEGYHNGIEKSTSISRVDALRLLRMTPPDDGLSQPTKPKQVIGFVDNSGHCHRIPAQSEIKPIGANHAIIPLPRMSPTLPAIGAVTQGQIYGLSHAAVAPSGPQTATRLIPVQLAEPAPPPAPSAYSSVAGPMQMPMPMTMTVPLPLAPSSFVVGGTVPPHMLGKPAMQPYYGMLPLSSSAGAPPTIYNPTQPSASPWHTQQSMADAVRPYDPGYGFMYAGAPQVFPYQQLQPQPLVQMQPSVQYQPASGVTAFAGGQYAVMVPR